MTHQLYNDIMADATSYEKDVLAQINKDTRLTCVCVSVCKYTSKLTSKGIHLNHLVLAFASGDKEARLCLPLGMTVDAVVAIVDYNKLNLVWN